jgi:hypothetical protein
MIRCAAVLVLEEVVSARCDERAAARQRAVDDRRRNGASVLVDEVIVTAVGLPTLLWHLCRARRISSVPEPSRPGGGHEGKGVRASGSSSAIVPCRRRGTEGPMASQWQ